MQHQPVPNAVINEKLRLHPLVAAGSGSGGGGVDVASVWVPPFSLQRTANVFQAEHAWNLARWLVYAEDSGCVAATTTTSTESAAAAAAAIVATALQGRHLTALCILRQGATLWTR